MQYIFDVFCIFLQRKPALILAGLICTAREALIEAGIVRRAFFERGAA